MPDSRRRSNDGGDLGYLSLPLRKIVKRFVVVDFDRPYYPEHRIELECGHDDFDRGQKLKARCGPCGPERKGS